jgi:MFS family permease
MHSSDRVAGQKTSSGMAQQVALIAWSISISLIFAATVIWFILGGNLSQSVHIIIIGIAFGLYSTIGALIVRQRPRNTIGWILCAIGIGTAITDFSGAYTAYGMVNGHLPLPGTEIFNWLGNTVWPINWVLFLVFLPLLFPDGRLLTRRWGIVGWLAAVLALLSILAGWLSLANMGLFGTGISSDFWSSLSSKFNLLVLPLTIAALVSLVLRFIRAKERERQQIKWLTYGTAIMAMLIIGGFLVFNDPNSPIVGLIFSFAIMLLPLSIGISILRNQLYDIDRLINRTFVYGILTILLTLVYFGLVFGLQALARLFTGQVSQSPVAIVISTLVIAALFQPLRHRIQRIIDRRFYRSKYNAATIIANFSSTLREEVDLETLSEHLVVVVQETMQPAHVSLWLRKPGQGRKHNPE